MLFRFFFYVIFIADASLIVIASAFVGSDWILSPKTTKFNGFYLSISPLD